MTQLKEFRNKSKVNNREMNLMQKIVKLDPKSLLID